jgi:hypothetical protein
LRGPAVNEAVAVEGFDLASGQQGFRAELQLGRPYRVTVWPVDGKLVVFAPSSEYDAFAVLE